MLSIIIFIVGVIITLTCSLIILTPKLSWLFIVLVVNSSIIGMIAINAVVAIVCCKLLPQKWFNQEKKIFNPSKKECKFYEKIGIKKWKDYCIDLGQLNGFKKDKIENKAEFIERFILENNMGFIDHLVSAFVSLVAIFILPSKFWIPIGIPVGLTSFVLNVLPLMILRYNMPRLKTMLKFSLRNEKKI